MPLLTNLISYWKLDEASGNAADSHGSNLMGDIATQGGVTGKINNARSFLAASSNYMESASNADLETGDIDFTVQAWVNMASLPANGITYGIVSKWTSAGFRDYDLGVYTSGATTRFYFEVRTPADAASAFVEASVFGNPSASTWYLVHGWHDAVNNQIGVSVNANTETPLAHSAGVNVTSATFQFGNYFAANYFNGLIDEVALWKRVLTSQERTDLYNGGAGLAYPLTVGGGPAAILMGDQLN